MDSDVVIAGGGLNGPALALALAQAGLKVTLIDARPAPARTEIGFDGRAYALALASKRLLMAIGIWDKIGEKAQPILHIRASDGHAGHGAAPFFLSFDSSEIEEGPMGFMLEDRHLYRAFLEAVMEEPKITLISGVKVVDQTPEHQKIMVSMDDGTHLSARLLIGCDGRGSMVAQRAGIKRHGWSYGQIALVTAVHHEKSHNGTAHQFFMPSGPFAILPLAGGHHSSIVWSEKESIAQEIHALNDTDYLAALRPRFGDFLGEIALAGARFTYPLSLSLADRFLGNRVALVGDAAHGVHPIAGQGLNLGLRDVAALAETLIDATRRGEDLGAEDVLERYEHWRRFDTTLLALGMDGVNRAFSSDNPLLRLGRDLGMAFVSGFPTIRRAMLRQAAGLSASSPRLLNGQRL